MVFKKSPLLLLLTPFPNYYNEIIKKGKKKHCNRTATKKQTKTENILITNNLKSLDVKLRSIASAKT